MDWRGLRGLRGGGGGWRGFEGVWAGGLHPGCT